MNQNKQYYRALIIFLLAGTAWAWANTIQDFLRFYSYEGTIWKFTNCAIPNPFTEACMYGALGFLVGLIWALVIYAKSQRGVITNQMHYLWLFLSGGTIFAYYNVVKEFMAFYSAGPEPALGCSAVPITNPFLTPCFTGAALFLLSAIVSGLLYQKLKK